MVAHCIFYDYKGPHLIVRVIGPVLRRQYFKPLVDELNFIAGSGPIIPGLRR